MGKRAVQQEEAADASELDASGLTAQQKAALHVPSAAQLELYQRLVDRAKALSLELLEHEKRGGKLGDLGLLELTQGTPTAHNLLLHRLHHSPMSRLQRSTLADKESDEVTQHSSIPARLFRAQMLPLIADIEQYTGADQLHVQRKQQRHKVALLEAEVSDAEKQFEQERKKAQEELEQAVRMAKGLFATDSDAPALQASAQPQSDTHADSTPAEASAEAAPSSAATASSATSSPSATEHPSQARAAKKEAKKAKAKPAATTTPSRSVPSEPPAPLSPTAQHLQHVLSSLSTKADRLYAPLPSTPAPAHPARFDARDLCQLRAERKLDSLSIRDLKEAQTHAQLMAQPKPLLRGKKEHHLAVVQAWLDTCTCAAHQSSSAKAQDESNASAPSDAPSL